MLILALDSALARCSAGLVRDGVAQATRLQDGGRGQAAALPVMVAALLAEAGVAAAALELVAVTVGPGSFTGIRAALALAHGIGLGGGVPVVGVSVGEALAEAFPQLDGRQLWTAIDSRRGRVFVERDGVAAAFELAALPRPAGPVALAGDAAIVVAARLAALDADVMLTDARLPTPRQVAAAAARRAAGGLPPREAQPLYVDPPEARLPAGGLRPAPVG